jgi:hypothetical protein
MKLDEGEAAAANAPFVGDVRAWTTEQVADWLRGEGLEQHVPLACQQGLVGNDLLELSHEDLASLGLVTFQSRRALMRACVRLRLQAATNSAT